MADVPLTFARTEATRPFWDAAQEGQLMLPRCAGCQRMHWYPRHTCPYCGSRDLGWVCATGEAEVLTFAVAQQGFTTAGVRREPPYIVAIVRLAEGPTMTTNLVECPPKLARIGMRVRVRFQNVAGETVVPVFAPSTPDQTTLHQP